MKNAAISYLKAMPAGPKLSSFDSDRVGVSVDCVVVVRCSLSLLRLGGIMCRVAPKLFLEWDQKGFVQPSLEYYSKLVSSNMHKIEA